MSRPARTDFWRTGGAPFFEKRRPANPESGGPLSDPYTPRDTSVRIARRRDEGDYALTPGTGDKYFGTAGSVNGGNGLPDDRDVAGCHTLIRLRHLLPSREKAMEPRCR